MVIFENGCYPKGKTPKGLENANPFIYINGVILPYKEKYMDYLDGDYYITYGWGLRADGSLVFSCENPSEMPTTKDLDEYILFSKLNLSKGLPKIIKRLIVWLFGYKPDIIIKLNTIYIRRMPTLGEIKKTIDMFGHAYIVQPTGTSAEEHIRNRMMETLIKDTGLSLKIVSHRNNTDGVFLNIHIVSKHPSNLGFSRKELKEMQKMLSKVK